MTSNGVYEELTAEECAALLGRTSIGRLAGVAEGRPFVFPVNYAFDGNTVVFRTSPGTKLAGSAFARVAFEIDGVDEGTQTGWSVIVQGVGAEVTDAVDLQSLAVRRLDLAPWVPGPKAHWVAIRAGTVTGRRLCRE